MTPIAHIETPYRSKFGVPRQAGLAATEALVVFEPEYRVGEAVRGLDGFDYVWLLWQFHLNRRGEEKNTGTWSPTVRPPRLGGNKRVGVFATRSPFRPNPIGLSSVRLLSVEVQSSRGPLLHIAGADLVDGTPIFDIKPYIPYADAHPDARAGFAVDAPERLTVCDPDGHLAALTPSLAASLRESLSLDPRPHYQHDPQRRYVMEFDRYEVAFVVEDNVLIILNVSTN